jgi:hypothetical protein
MCGCMYVNVWVCVCVGFVLCVSFGNVFLYLLCFVLCVFFHYVYVSLRDLSVLPLNDNSVAVSDNNSNNSYNKINL